MNNEMILASAGSGKASNRASFIEPGDYFKLELAGA
jgi:hypothetical protein